MSRNAAARSGGRTCGRPVGHQLCEHVPVTAHADDYLWFGQEYRELMEAYCLTLVRGLTAEETLTRFGAAPDRTIVTGVRSLFEPSYGVWDEHEGDRLLLGVADLGGWSLVVEPNGYLIRRDA